MPHVPAESSRSRRVHSRNEKMQRRKLGQLDVSAIGLGCATMTPFYGEPDPAEAIATIRRAPELGIDLLDTSDAYGNGRNEELISGAIEGRRSEYIIASKFGNLRRPDGTPTADGRPEYVRLACERAACAGCAPNSSTSTISTGSIRRCRSRTRSAR
jgi:hypothetical protein